MLYTAVNTMGGGKGHVDAEVLSIMCATSPMLKSRFSSQARASVVSDAGTRVTGDAIALWCLI